MEYLEAAYLVTGIVFYVVFTAWGIWSLLPLRKRKTQDFNVDELPVVIIDRSAGRSPHMH